MSEPMHIRLPNFDGKMGKYDDVSQEILTRFKALAVALLVVEGERGNGISISMHDDPLLKMAIGLALKRTGEQMIQEAGGFGPNQNQ